MRSVFIAYLWEMVIRSSSRQAAAVEQALPVVPSAIEGHSQAVGANVVND